jgi:ribosomal protein S9
MNLVRNFGRFVEEVSGLSRIERQISGNESSQKNEFVTKTTLLNDRRKKERKKESLKE